MRSRIAITALLATGALMSSGGAAIGVTALSTTRDASQAQYGTVATTETSTTPTATTPTATVPPRSGTLAGGDEGGDTPSSGIKGTSEESPTAQAQPARQLESTSDGKLPFTGYAAIPLLLGGLALLLTGVVLRRSTNGGQLT